MKKENQGFTLVELIVTVAILAIVGIGVGTMVSHALNNFRAANAEVNLQQESQLVGNQLMNLIMDANNGISMESGKLNLYHYNAADDVRSKTCIAYEDTNHTLVCTRYEAKGASDVWKPVESEAEERMAEYVTGFSVELLDENGVVLTTLGDRGDGRVRRVKICIYYELDGESYDFEQTVTLRNQLFTEEMTTE